MYNPLIALVIGVLLIAGGALLFWPETGLFNRWQRSRRVTQRVLSEDALKYIHQAQLQGQTATLSGLAGTLQISPNRAADLLADLDQRGLVTFDGDEPRLTPDGREAALHVIRAHRLWERHLAEDTGFAEAEWHQLAEHYEHELTPSQVDALAARLGHPTHDPHGDPIPTPDGELIEHGGQPLTTLPVADLGVSFTSKMSLKPCTRSSSPKDCIRANGCACSKSHRSACASGPTATSMWSRPSSPPTSR